jgi:hypothetical protein
VTGHPFYTTWYHTSDEDVVNPRPDLDRSCLLCGRSYKEHERLSVLEDGRPLLTWNHAVQVLGWMSVELGIEAPKLLDLWYKGLAETFEEDWYKV